jgi:hypothetical protein
MDVEVLFPSVLSASSGGLEVTGCSGGFPLFLFLQLHSGRATSQWWYFNLSFLFIPSFFYLSFQLTQKA